MRVFVKSRGRDLPLLPGKPSAAVLWSSQMWTEVPFGLECATSSGWRVRHTQVSP